MRGLNAGQLATMEITTPLTAGQPMDVAFLVPEKGDT